MRLILNSLRYANSYRRFDANDTHPGVIASELLLGHRYRPILLTESIFSFKPLLHQKPPHVHKYTGGYLDNIIKHTACTIVSGSNHECWHSILEICEHNRTYFIASQHEYDFIIILLLCNKSLYFTMPDKNLKHRYLAVDVYSITYLIYVHRCVYIFWYLKMNSLSFL